MIAGDGTPLRANRNMIDFDNVDARDTTRENRIPIVVQAALMRNTLSLAIALVVMTAPPLFAACKTVPGASQLWFLSSTRWVWVGETHGTTEIPATFGDMVCDALADGRHVTVAIERPTTEQSAINSLIGSEDQKAAEHELLNQPDWREIYDGRTSQAMLELLLQLRTLKAQYPALRVAAIVDPDAFASSPAADDEAMGHSVLALEGKQPEDLVLVLTGNVHGVKNPILKHQTAAMYLPAAQLFSLQVTGAGGQAWTMNDKGCGASLAGITDKDKSRPFGIYPDPGLARFGVVDGILALGKPTTASPPANTAALATASCRQDFLSQPGKQSQ